MKTARATVEQAAHAVMNCITREGRRAQFQYFKQHYGEDFAAKVKAECVKIKGGKK